MAQFCPNMNFENTIINILCNNGIFTNYSRSTLNDVYVFLRNEYYYGTGYQLYPHQLTPSTLDINRLNIKNTTRLIYNASYNIYIGHDLPVWLTPDNIDKSKNIKRVMFISQDPRRSLDEMTNFGRISPTSDLISFSSPFGVHSASYSAKRGRGLFAKVAKRLSDDKKKNILVYMTDFYKFRVAEKKGNSYIDTPNKIIYDNILKKEINFFNPDLIVLISKGIASKFLAPPTQSISWYKTNNTFSFYGGTKKSIPVFHTAYAGLFKYLRGTYSRPFLDWASVKKFYFERIYNNI